MAERNAKHFLAGLALGALAIVAAAPSFAGCGGATTGYSAFAGPSDGGGNTTDATTSGGSSGSSSSGSSGSSSGGSEDSNQCAVGCTSDNQCQATCTPAPNGSTNCCDIGSGTCMMINQSSCPSPSDAGSE
jgi:hypothetical protein